MGAPQTPAQLDGQGKTAHERFARHQPALHPRFPPGGKLRTFLDLRLAGVGWEILDAWCRRVARSRLDPLKKTAATLKRHRQLLLNYFAAKKELTNSIVEGLNNKLKLILKRSFGFRTDLARKVALYHALAKLPEPSLTKP